MEEVSYTNDGTLCVEKVWTPSFDAMNINRGTSKKKTFALTNAGYVPLILEESLDEMNQLLLN
jgi:hypothetical protein